MACQIQIKSMNRYCYISSRSYINNCVFYGNWKFWLLLHRHNWNGSTRRRRSTVNEFCVVTNTGYSRTLISNELTLRHTQIILATWGAALQHDHVKNSGTDRFWTIRVCVCVHVTASMSVSMRTYCIICSLYICVSYRQADNFCPAVQMHQRAQ